MIRRALIVTYRTLRADFAAVSDIDTPSFTCHHLLPRRNVPRSSSGGMTLDSGVDSGVWGHSPGRGGAAD